MIRAIGANEALGLLHVDFSVELVIEERRLDIHLMKIELVLRRDTQDAPDRRALGHQYKRLFKVDTVLLQNPFSTSRALYLSMRSWAVFFT